jgi:hypothetical protein
MVEVLMSVGVMTVGVLSVGEITVGVPIDSVMVKALTCSVVDREFKSRSGQIKDCIKLVFAASQLSTLLWSCD